MTDEELVIMFKEGDETAFDELFKKYINQAVKTAYLITGNNILSEDIAQEAFITCHLKIDKLKNPSLFKAWLFKILTNEAIKTRKKTSRTVLVDNFTDNMQFITDISTEITDNFYYSDLYNEIQKLKVKQKTTVILYYFNNMSIREIAQITNSLESTVKSRLFLAKKNLKKSLQRKEWLNYE